MERTGSAVTHPSQRWFTRAATGCHSVRLVEEVAIMREAAQAGLSLLVALVADWFQRWDCLLYLHSCQVHISILSHFGHG